jgi:23S rRNA pseudouridine955/2504/2580 synthase
MAEEVTIGDDTAGQRIDNYLIKKLKGLPKSRIYKAIRKGEVRINKGRIKAEYRLQLGDIVRIPPVRCAEVPEVVPPNQGVRALIERSILFESKKMLVLNKPSGMAVHGGSGLSGGVIEILRIMRPKEHFLELAHRLDRPTSGCLLIAKKRSALLELQELIKLRHMKKFYDVVVFGAWKEDKRMLDAPLLRRIGANGERQVVVDKTGKASATLVRLVSTNEHFSHVTAQLLTGRTHQIRVHLTDAGFPIVGDDRYGDFAKNKRVAKDLGVKRLLLHASRLEFKFDGEAFMVEAPLPKEYGIC